VGAGMGIRPEIDRFRSQFNYLKMFDFLDNFGCKCLILDGNRDWFGPYITNKKSPACDRAKAV